MCVYVDWGIGKWKMEENEKRVKCQAKSYVCQAKIFYIFILYTRRGVFEIFARECHGSCYTCLIIEDG